MAEPDQRRRLIRVREVEAQLRGARGHTIVWRAWLPDASPGRGRVVIVHGLGEHGGRYHHVAERLTAAGFEVVVPDHHGHGRSQGRRVAIVAWEDFLDDLRLVIKAAEPDLGPAPLHLLGHSMGGLIAASYAIAHPGELQTLVLSAPAVLAPRNVSPLMLAVGRALSRLAPNLGTVALPLDKVSRDSAVVAAYFADPLVFRRRIRARLGAEMLGAIAEVGSGLPGLTLPLLVMQGTEDRLVEPEAARFVYEHAGSTDKTLKEYKGLYHEIFNEPERDVVLDDLVTWLEARSGARAAGAD